MKHFSKLGLALAATLMVSGVAMAQDPVTMVYTDAGRVMADSSGMVLYTFDKDGKGVSNCYDKCAVNWPPFYAKNGEASGKFTIVDRTDGTKMWAYKGAPLYFWVGDTEARQTSGDGVGGVWHVATKSLY